ncbi:MAG: hypothetical protein AB8B48_04870 [Pseudomonadales bacterium]
MTEHSASSNTMGTWFIVAATMLFLASTELSASAENWISKDAQIVELKKALSKLGHYDGPIDASGGVGGLFSPIMKFQSANGEVPLGQPTIETYEKILLAAKSTGIPDKTARQLDTEQQRRDAEKVDAELLKFTQSCKAQRLGQLFFDCECLTSAYSELRRKEPERHGFMIERAVRDMEHPACTSDPKVISAQVAQECSSQIKMAPEMDGKSPAEQQEYCSCIGNTVSGNFLKSPKAANAPIWASARGACAG